jgi:hypothetical protein
MLPAVMRWSKPVNAERQMLVAAAMGQPCERYKLRCWDARHPSDQARLPPVPVGPEWGRMTQFPSPNLSAGCGFSKETLAGARGNDEVAPIPAVRGTATEPLESTLKMVYRGGRDTHR